MEIIMSIQRMAHKLLSFFMLANISRGYQRRIALLRINAARGYITGIKKVRFFSLAVLFFCVALVLFSGGLFLLHAALFTYSSLSAQVKCIAAFILGGMEFTVAAAMMFFLFKESTWMKFMEIDQVVRSVTRDSRDHRGGSHETKTSQKEFSQRKNFYPESK